MEEILATWSQDMLEDIRPALALPDAHLDFALTGRVSRGTCEEETHIRCTYRGFTPLKGLDRVPFSISELGPELYPEDDLEPTADMGYLELGPVLQAGQLGYGPWIHAAIKKESGVFDLLDKMFVESGMFRSTATVTLSLRSLGLDAKPEEFFGIRLPVTGVQVDTESSCGGEWFVARNKNRPYDGRSQPRISTRTKVSYAWSILIRILVLLLAFGLFVLASTPFEAVVLAALTLVFVESRYMRRMSIPSLLMETARQSLFLARLLNDPKLERKEWKEWRRLYHQQEDWEEPTDAVVQYVETAKKLEISTMIETLFLAILSVMAVLSLLNSVFHFV